MNRIKDKHSDEDKDIDEKTRTLILQNGQQEQFDHDMSILDDEKGTREERLHKEAEKDVRTAAEDSLKKLHIIQRGHCPKCGEPLHKHLFASICDNCGWHAFDTPNEGPVRVHLSDNRNFVEGERCYVVKKGDVLVLKKDIVVAKVPASSVSWIEYLWNDEEISQRHRQVVDQMTILCGWCNKEADPENDGFHLVHVALGGTQERYCFCSDDCYEAFRKMYPARVHRDCYERKCDDCNLCVKRYGSEEDGFYMLAKDYLRSDRKIDKKIHDREERKSST